MSEGHNGIRVKNAAGVDTEKTFVNLTRTGKYRDVINKQDCIFENIYFFLLNPTTLTRHGFLCKFAAYECAAKACVQPLSYRGDYHGTKTVNDVANYDSGTHSYGAPQLSTLKSLIIRECCGT